MYVCMSCVYMHTVTNGIHISYRSTTVSDVLYPLIYKIYYVVIYFFPPLLFSLFFSCSFCKFNSETSSSSSSGNVDPARAALVSTLLVFLMISSRTHVCTTVAKFNHNSLLVIILELTVIREAPPASDDEGEED